MAESVESGEILSSSSEWNLDSDELFVICLNHNSENKRAIPIQNCLDHFMNTSLNHMSIRSCLVIQSKNRFVLSSE